MSVWTAATAVPSSDPTPGRQDGRSRQTPWSLASSLASTSAEPLRWQRRRRLVLVHVGLDSRNSRSRRRSNSGRQDGCPGRPVVAGQLVGVHVGRTATAVGADSFWFTSVWTAATAVAVVGSNSRASRRPLKADQRCRWPARWRHVGSNCWMARRRRTRSGSRRSGQPQQP